MSAKTVCVWCGVSPGGGAVYHDMGNLNFTFIADAGDMEPINFRLFCRPVVAALAKIGVTAEINGRNDMTIDGQKFSGNSQYLKEGRVMHHGTIMFDSNLDLVAQALHVDQEKIRAKGIASVRSRVTTVRRHMTNPVGLEEFRHLLLQEILEQQPRRRVCFHRDGPGADCPPARAAVRHMGVELW